MSAKVEWPVKVIRCLKCGGTLANTSLEGWDKPCEDGTFEGHGPSQSVLVQPVEGQDA